MAFKRYRRRRFRRRRRFGRKRRSRRTALPGRPVTDVRISSNPRRILGARDCGHARTVGFERLIDLTGEAPGGIQTVTYADICNNIAPVARTDNMVLSVRYVYAWSGIPNGGTIHGYLYQDNCMNLSGANDGHADGTIAISDTGSAFSMPKIGFKIPWTARKGLEMNATNKPLSVAHFTHYGPVQTDAAKTKYYLYVRVGCTFWM